ncbi:MAG: LPXTG cell wall anchor domain-containing protein [Lachnospiraceae bacterium]|nr:LPXTG cell wall anchor domain-containing protein [Lachnospiraceae bacterium]
MKSINKIMTYVLSTAMLITTLTPLTALAAPTPLDMNAVTRPIHINITTDNGNASEFEGRTYSAYKIFDVSISDNDTEETIGAYGKEDRYAYYVERRINDPTNPRPNPWFAFLCNVPESQVTFSDPSYQTGWNTLKADLASKTTALDTAETTNNNASIVAYRIDASRRDLEEEIARITDLKNAVDTRAASLNAEYATVTEAERKGELAQLMSYVGRMSVIYDEVLGATDNPNTSLIDGLSSDTGRVASLVDGITAYINTIDAKITSLASSNPNEVVRLEGVRKNLMEWKSNMEQLRSELDGSNVARYDLDGDGTSESTLLSKGSLKYMKAQADSNYTNANSTANSASTALETARTNYNNSLQAATNFITELNPSDGLPLRGINSIQTNDFILTRSVEDLNKYNVSRVNGRMEEDDLTGLTGQNISEFARRLYEELETNPSLYTPEDTIVYDSSITTHTPDGQGVVKSNHLEIGDFGYYFVSSSMGSIAAITTSTVAKTGSVYSFNVLEKNSMPSLEKKVKNSEGTYVEEVVASVGSEITFRTEITDGLGTSKQLVLRDKMGEGLKLRNIKVYRPIIVEGATTEASVANDAGVMNLPGRYPVAVQKGSIYVPADEAYALVREGNDHMVDIVNYNASSPTNSQGNSVNTHTLPVYAAVWMPTFEIYSMDGVGGYKAFDQLPAGVTADSDDTYIIIFSEDFMSWFRQGKDNTVTPFERHDSIRIEYTAELTGLGIQNHDFRKYSNAAKLEYDNTESAEDTASVFTVLMDLQKIAADNKSQLEGAQFQLLREDGYTPILLKSIETNGTVYSLGETGVVNGVTIYRPATLEETVLYENMSESDKAASPYTYIMTFGRARLRGMGEGTYYLTETVPPVGYNILSHPIKFSLSVEKSADGETIMMVDSTNPNVGETDPNDSSKKHVVSRTLKDVTTSNTGIDLGKIFKIENGTGSLLPTTGGIGTTIFYIIGGILIAGAVVMLVARHRMKED